MSHWNSSRATPWLTRSPELWGDSESIRAELYNDEQLQRHAVSLAEVQIVVRNAKPVVTLLQRVEQNRKVLVDCFESITSDIGSDRSVTPAAEWLVDNFHSIEENIRQIRQDLPRGYFRQLPKLGPGFLEGHPRIFGIVWGYIAHTDSNVDPDGLGRYIRAHETRKALTLGELWAVPINLRIALVENARRLAEAIVDSAKQRAAADRAADLILGLDGSPPVGWDEAVTHRDQLNPGRAFAVQLARRLSEQPAEAAIAWVQGELLAHGPDAEDAISTEHQSQAQATMTMHNIFRSLRALTDTNWEDWLESVSLIETALRSNPGFAALDFGTRNLYRSAIERLARGSGQDEIDVARAALVLAGTSPDEVGQDVGFWLVDKGLAQFEHSLAYRSPLRERAIRTLVASGLGGYLVATSALTGILVALTLMVVGTQSGGLGLAWLILLGLLAAIPASDFALDLINFRVTKVMQASFLPGLALREGVPEDLRTLVVVPTMLTTSEGVEELLDNLEVHFHANDDGEIYFAAVTDWLDSPTESADGDEALLQAVQSGVRKLNARHGERFFLFHRSRRFNASEGVWMGWERKRGKLDELNRLLRGADDTSYTTLEGRTPGRFRFVITLDADTVLPRGAAQRLVAKLAHPLNKARFDNGVVTRGYSILQPRVTPSLPPQEHTSFFQTVYSTLQGLDPYAFTVSDVYQDLFGEGSFAGKGIYDIDAFHAALADRIPENSVLSHDLLEGNYARAALVTDVEVVEDHPTSYAVAASRSHRWTRGDWQLLPWILGRRQGLSALGLWKMLDNLRRSLIPVSLVAGVVVAMAVLSAAALASWIVLVAALFFASTVIRLIPSILRRAHGITAASRARTLLSDARAGLIRGSLDFVFVSHQAAMMVDAIGRTFWRMLVTHRNLLEWTTAATAQRRTADGQSYLRSMAGGLIAPVIILAIGVWRGPLNLALVIIPAVVWLLAPLIAERVSRRYQAIELAVTAQELDYLTGIARRTWGYFEAFVTDEENQLPPDNFQEDPAPVVAHRTSPTNIGLYLLATVGARDFGWIGLPEALRRLEATITTLTAMEHHRGHLYNWYDTRTLAPLWPRYVSSVDSGNLAGNLLVLASTCREWIDDPGLGCAPTETPLDAPAADGLRRRLEQVEKWCRQEFADMDFSFLLDPHRGLLSVGYQVGDGRLDESCYDLLASECRLASFTAIAKGDIPTRHWKRLGRPVTAAGGGAALLSWSGSMFEYLMPSLVMRTPATSLLSSTARRVVRRQIEYGHQLGLPWGISESGYYARDPDHNFQYSPFGVPGLGIVRRLGDNLVVAPYATGLAAMIRPSAAAANYQRLSDLGVRGQFGFYEAVDFTRARLPEGQEFAIVRSYMAHHQGMTILAIHNVVLDGVMRERFHREPIIRATQLLLQERAPQEVPITHASEDGQDSPTLRAAIPASERMLTGADATTPGLHLMSNGRLSLSLTPAGGGQLTWNGLAITRWRPDLTTSDTGDYLYLRDDETNELWSATAEPVRDLADAYEVRFAEDRARYSRKDGTLRTTVEHHLSPESDAVVRKIKLKNTGRQTRRITVTSYAELVLAAARDDAAHPVFSKMFVHTEYLRESAAIVATRRRRSNSEAEVWVAHFLVTDARAVGPIGEPVPETDRLAFIGRNRSTRSPRRFDRGVASAQHTGYVLDPILSLGQSVEVPPDTSVSLSYWTVVASSRDELLRLVDQHRAGDAYERVTMMGWTQSQIQLRHLGITSEEAGLFQTLAGHVMFPQRSMRATDRHLQDAGPQSALWPLSVSGDLPIVVVRVNDRADLQLARETVKASEFWRLKRFPVDLVLLNERSTSYVQDLQQDLFTLAGTSADFRPTEPLGRVFVVRRDQAGAETISALLAAAAVVLVARRGDLTKQLARPKPVGLPPTIEQIPSQVAATRGGHHSQELRLFNGLGGFSADGREYVTVLDGASATPAPWINVVANEQFGFHATAEGAGYTWWQNSRDNQLTPWRNDPVSAPISEAIYVRDEESGRVCSPTASPVPGGRHVAHHGFGYTRFTHDFDGVELDETVFVALDDPVKLTSLVLKNTTDKVRSLRVTAYAELVLGMEVNQAARHLITELDLATGALLVRNPWSTQFPDQVVFFDLAGRQDSWTGDRGEFLGAHGTPELPLAVFSGRPLSGAVGVGMDPCAALQRLIVLEPGQSETVQLVMGAGHGAEEIRELVTRYRNLDADEVLAGVRRLWERRLSVVQVRTPSPAFDMMMNGWLLYQTLACRMLARSGYYQASGAYGFRDQLQDSMTVALVEPGMARAHILRAAGRQFLEGDVQHWWLPASGEGIRTRISDDVVWLPSAVCHYVTLTGDATVLDEPIPFLEGQVLAAGETDCYFQPVTSKQTASVYEHCVLALEHALVRGRHGLPLIGTGDWNDGLNRVGAAGEGESVWLAWFLIATLAEFGEVARGRGDVAFAERCAEEGVALAAAVEAHGWDGQWYRRGYFDDGTPLGSASRPEARIDGIAQSWAVLSGAADPVRARQAMEQTDAQLVMADAGLVRLFTPPFDTSQPDPGYVASYPPGMRENGGQYTHGALWSVFAWAKLGREDRAAAIFQLINPVNHALSATAAQRYRVEPYVVAADVYSEEPNVGRGGWTWYTGSAGWMYRAGLEAVLGLRREGDTLLIDPCLLPEWHEVSVSYRFGDTRYEISIEADAATPRSVAQVSVDGVPTPGRWLPLIDDGRTHSVRVVMESRSTTDGEHGAISSPHGSDS